MAFKLAKSETFRMNVTIETQDEKGRTEKEAVFATYTRPSESQLEELEGLKNDAVCERMLVNVEGIIGPDGQAVPYAGDFKVALLAIPPATFALAAAFWQGARLGRAKN